LSAARTHTPRPIFNARPGTTAAFETMKALSLIMLSDLIKDGGSVTLATAPLALFGSNVTPALILSAISILVTTVFRVVELRMRAKERRETVELQLKLARLQTRPPSPDDEETDTAETTDAETRER
jgi:hypothetical protein